MDRRKDKTSANQTPVNSLTQYYGELDLAKQKEDDDPVRRVFELDLLLEIIIHFTIRQDDGSKLCKSNLGTLRLVSKSWQATVSDILRRKCEPMFHLTLKDDNWKLLVEKFMQTFDPTKTECFFFLNLEVHEALFDPESTVKYTFEAFMRQFANCVLNLDMNIPLVASWKLANHFQERLPILQKLTLDMSIKYSDKVLAAAHVLSQRRTKLSEWLQFQLDGNNTLKELTLSHMSSSNFVYLPPMPLLESLTKLDISGNFGIDVIGTLSSCVFPSLANLVLCLMPYCVPIWKEAMTSMLQNFGKTLRVLELDICDMWLPQQTVHCVSFPVMEKLEELKSEQGSWQLDSDSLDIGHYFPKLKRLYIFLQTEAMFAKWTSGRPAPKVEKLGIEIIRRIGFGYVDKMDVQLVNKTFVNLRSLTLKLNDEQRNSEGLGSLYKSLKQLTSLHLGLKNNVNRKDWDFVLTLLPDSVISKSKRRAAIVEVTSEVMPSIKDLTGLEKLSLSDITGKNSSVISDFVFDYALLKMTQLKELNFGEKMKVSLRSAQAWRNKGGKFTFTSEI